MKNFAEISIDSLVNVTGGQQSAPPSLVGPIRGPGGDIVNRPPPPIWVRNPKTGKLEKFQPET